MTKSDYALRHGLDNTPPSDVLPRLTALCENVLERIRAYVTNGKPIIVNSGYRSAIVNAGIGGSPTSQHMRGEAADIDIPGMSHKQAIIAIMNHGSIPFDQMIHEGGDDGWIHISLNLTHNRREVLTATFVEGKAIYTSFV